MDNFNCSNLCSSHLGRSLQPNDRENFDSWRQTKVLDLAPVIVLDILFMLFGVVGNSTVSYVCYFHLPRNVINSFVMTLALVELLGCVLTIPVDITEIVNAFSFDFIALCKVERYFRKFVVFSSGCILVAIATERYKRIVKPYSRHVTMAEFRGTIVGALAFSAVMAVPEAILAGNQTTRTPYGKAIVCSTYTSDSYGNTVFPKIWGLICVLIYLTSATSIGAIYFAIASKIWTRNKVKTDHRSKANTPDSTLQRRIRPHLQSALSKKEETNIYFTYSPRFSSKPIKSKRNSLPATHFRTDKIRSIPFKENVHTTSHCLNMVSRSVGESCFLNDNNKTYTFSHIVDTSDEVSLERTFRSLQSRRARHSNKHRNNRAKSTLFLDELLRGFSRRVQRRSADHFQEPEKPSTDIAYTLPSLTPMGSLRRRSPGYSRKRTTFIMFVMTITTVLSYLPHIAAMMYKLTRPGVDTDLQADISVMYRIMWNSYFISLATHPYIYGFWNGRFKHALCSLFIGISRKRLRAKEQFDSCSSNRQS